MENDRRFGVIILLFRLAGIPFHIKKMSIIYAVYMTTVIICVSTSYLGMFVDVRTQGRFGTRYDNHACVNSGHECYVDLYLLQVRKNAYNHCYSKTSSYQTQRYSFSNVKIQYKCIAEDKPREFSILHPVIICFRLGSVYHNSFKKCY